MYNYIYLWMYAYTSIHIHAYICTYEYAYVCIPRIEPSAREEGGLRCAAHQPGQAAGGHRGFFAALHQGGCSSRLGAADGHALSWIHEPAVGRCAMIIPTYHTVSWIMTACDTPAIILLENKDVLHVLWSKICGTQADFVSAHYLNTPQYVDMGVWECKNESASERVALRHSISFLQILLHVRVASSTRGTRTPSDSKMYLGQIFYAHACASTKKTHRINSSQVNEWARE